MYNNLNLYYLNLLGIQPWISKKSLIDAIPMPRARLIILTTPNLSSFEKTLLKQILIFLELKPEEYKHLEFKPDHRMDDVILNAEYILSMDINPELAFNDDLIFKSDSLKTLLEKPLYKKQLCYLLTSLKNQLIASI